MEHTVVNRNKPGHDVSGDTYVFYQDDDHTLVAVIDGLGSGKAAHKAATKARICVAANPTAALLDILRACHKALRGTRGAVMMVMRIDRAKETVSFTGVGNIGVRVISTTPIRPISRNGIVGFRMSNIKVFNYPYVKGDVFILHSDGISSRFTVDEKWIRDQRSDLHEIATEIADEFGKKDDLIVVITR